MTVLILRHTPGNTLGHLTEVLEERNIPYAYRSVYRTAPDELVLTSDISGLVILGGFEIVCDETRYPFMAAEQQLIRDAIREDLPIFGICLGAQMMARSLGGRVEKNPAREVGWTPLTLTPEGRADAVLSVLDGVAQFQWHEDTFHLPHGLEPLAGTDLCPRQAFKLNKKVYGVQFHPEVTPDIIEAWLRKSTSLSTGEKDAILSETKEFHASRSQSSQEMFKRYCLQAY